jgi:hypothetical protein
MGIRFIAPLALVLLAAPVSATGNFVCYKSKDLKQPKFAGTTVPLLEDQFAAAATST